MHPSGASEIHVEVAPGPAQFQVRKPDAIRMLRMADCGLGRISALASIGRIADGTSGALQCEDSRNRLAYRSP
eukprot:15438181-Alexandrium_andersonii.AAC.1